MAREKVTITLDRASAAEARSLVGASSTSEVIDIALRRLIREERTRRDVEAYLRQPLTEDEIGLAGFADPPALDDDTDWEVLYGLEEA